MGFKQSWNKIAQRVVAFNYGMSDNRNPIAILNDIERAIGEARIAVQDNHPGSISLDGFTETEERLAQVVTDLMFLSGKLNLRLPDAMVTRSTKIRETWKNNQGAEKTWDNSDF